MPRGGKRAGAGRPRGTGQLSYMQRLAIGAMCESLLAETLRKLEEKKISEVTNNVREVWNEARSIPVSDRGAWLESEEFIEYQEEVEEALKMDQGLTAMPEGGDDDDWELYKRENKEPERMPDRVIGISISKPKGTRQSILSIVSKRTGRTTGYVSYCWKLLRKYN